MIQIAENVELGTVTFNVFVGPSVEVRDRQLSSVVAQVVASVLICRM